MRVLVFGAHGFIGRAVVRHLAITHDVYGTIRSGELGHNEVYLDLSDVSRIEEALRKIQPEVIINCAGIVDTTQDVSLNEIYTRNIIQAIVNTELRVTRVVISGSAAEYGYVEESEIPVNEDTPLRATGAYGVAKVKEERIALELGKTYNIPVIVARIFNPLGRGMAKKFFIPSVRKQLDEYRTGARRAIEISRKDSLRDYISVEDIATAIGAIIEGTPHHSVYNIGSGVSTSNAELLQLMVDNSKIKAAPRVIETAADKERHVAARADISRLKQDFGWQPGYKIADTIRETMND